MSGSRGGYFGQTNKTIGEIREAAQRAAEDHAFDSKVNELLAQRLVVLGSRDAAATRIRLDEIQECLGDALEERLDVLLGGSLSKRTYLEGMSDIDALVLVPAALSEGRSPDQLRHEFAEALREKLSMANVESITEGRLAVTVNYRDGLTIQLLPSKRSAERLQIANARGTGWSTIRPREFAETLTRANEEQANRLIPTIKLAKLIVASFPEARRLSGYHVECLAVDAFEGYTGTRTYKEMLRQFFQSAAERVLDPIRDQTGQSVHVDADLGSADSLQRRLASDSLGRVARRIVTSHSIEDWIKMTTPPDD